MFSQPMKVRNVVIPDFRRYLDLDPHNPFLHVLDEDVHLTLPLPRAQMPRLRAKSLCCDASTQQHERLKQLSKQLTLSWIPRDE